MEVDYLGYPFDGKMDASYKSFYVILPSNVKSSSNNNKTSHYITPLPRALELPSKDWEVALVEINYPYSFYNVLPPLNVVYLGIQRGPTVQLFTRQIEPGFYRSIDTLIAAINDTIPNIFKGFFKKEMLNYENDSSDDLKDGVTVVLAKNEFIEIHSDIAEMFGFTSALFDNRGEAAKQRKKIKSKSQPVLGTDLYNLYVYSNIVKDTLVGDRFVPLLRTISVDGKNGDYIQKVFETPHYLPLANDFFQHIEIKVADDLGQCIRFKYGKVIVKLHFRQKVKHD